MFKKLGAAALVSLATLAMASNAQAGEVEAYGGIAADAVTTGIALSTPGIVETNPLGWATVPIRLAIMQYAKSLPREEGQPVMDAVSATGWGAAANNLAVLAGMGPIGPVVALAVGYTVWKSGENERDFWVACAAQKSMEAGVSCEYKPWNAADVTRIAQEMHAQKQMLAQARIEADAAIVAGN
jgi:hypothetical protein